MRKTYIQYDDNGDITGVVISSSAPDVSAVEGVSQWEAPEESDISAGKHKMNPARNGVVAATLRPIKKIQQDYKHKLFVEKAFVSSAEFMVLADAYYNDIRKYKMVVGKLEEKTQVKRL